MVAIFLLSNNFLVASAAGYEVIDYQDYVENVTYDDDTKIITSYFPWQMNFMQLTQNDEALKYGHGTSNFVCEWDLLTVSQPSNLYDFYVVSRPLGFSVLNLENIPDDSVLTMEYRVQWGNMPDSNGRMTVQLQYYDAQQNWLGVNTVYTDYTLVSDPNSIYMKAPAKVVKPNGAKYMMIRVEMHFYAEAADVVEPTFSVYPSSLRIDFSIDSLMLLDSQNQKILERLDDVEKQNQTIIDQNQTIIDGTPEQNQQVDQAVGELDSAGDKLSDLSDEMQVEKPDVESMDVSINSFIPETSLLAYTGPILAFWENDSLLAMLIIVLTLVLVSWVMFGKKG